MTKYLISCRDEFRIGIGKVMIVVYWCLIGKMKCPYISTTAGCRYPNFDFVLFLLSTDNDNVFCLQRCAISFIMLTWAHV